MGDSGNKTPASDVQPVDFIAAVEPESRREDALRLLDFFNTVTQLQPQMWGPSIIGYGRYHYRYDSGREGEYFLTGFSPRKANLTIYVMPGFGFGDTPDRLLQLGKHTLGKSCLYVRRLSDIDMDVLAQIVRDGVACIRTNYQTWDV